MQPLDPIDYAILQQLRLNARISNAKLAEQVGLSPSACLRRIRLLEKKAIIRGYTVLTDPVARQSAITVIVNITLERQTEDYLKRFEAAVRRYPEIRECYLMTGGSDYLLQVEVDNSGEFERVHTDILSTLPGVVRVHSSFSIRNVLASQPRHGR